MNFVQLQFLAWGMAIGWYIHWAILHSRLERRIDLINRYRQFIQDHADKISGDKSTERLIASINEKQDDALYIRMLKSDRRNTANPYRLIKLSLKIMRLERDVY